MGLEYEFAFFDFFKVHTGSSIFMFRTVRVYVTFYSIFSDENKLDSFLRGGEPNSAQ